MNDSTITLLVSVALATPLVGAALIVMLRGSAAKYTALLATLLPLLAGLGATMLLMGDQPLSNDEGMLFSQTASWFSADGADIKYMIGIDGVSGFMLLLTVLLFPLLIAYQWQQDLPQERLFYGMLLLLETGIIGFFLSLDLLMFYIFFELVLIPTAFLIGIWGHAERQQAALKFFLYTLAGSLLMLISILYLGINATGIEGAAFTTDYFTIRDALRGGQIEAFGLDAQRWLFLGFAISFAIKVPLFPLHTWQAQTYSESSTTGSIVLAALLSKMGAYGFIRFCLPLFPAISREMAPTIAGLAVVGILYGAYLAVVQSDLKRLIAFSSLSHLGFILLGIFAMTPEALSGAILQMFAHGVTTAGMFFMADMLERRYPSREIADFQGVAKGAPLFTLLFMITIMASVGLPGLSGFVGEFLILMGAFDSLVINRSFAILGTLGVILAAVYLLNMFRKVMFGPADGSVSGAISDASRREALIMLPLIVLMFWVGLYATPFLDAIEAGTQAVIQQVAIEVPADLPADVAYEGTR
jgi:NADH-quinone oxidoreductase subunit M